MKKLKKFNEHWVDDENEDTNRRMAELDNKEGLNEPEEPNIEEEELIDKIHGLLVEYRNKLTPEQISLILTDLARQPELWSWDK